MAERGVVDVQAAMLEHAERQASDLKRIRQAAEVIAVLVLLVLLLLVFTIANVASA